MHIVEFINDNIIPVLEDSNSEIEEVRQYLEVAHSLINDPYMTRGMFWGVAAAFENQYNYLTTNFGRNLESRLNRLTGSGVLSESTLDEYKFANEEKPHINEDVTLNDQIAEVKQLIDRNNEKRFMCAVMFYFARKQHDEVSLDLQQLTYSAIKAKAAAKRAA